MEDFIPNINIMFKYLTNVKIFRIVGRCLALCDVSMLEDK